MCALLNVSVDNLGMFFKRFSPFAVQGISGHLGDHPTLKRVTVGHVTKWLHLRPKRSPQGHRDVRLGSFGFYTFFSFCRLQYFI